MAVIAVVAAAGISTATAQDSGTPVMGSSAEPGQAADAIPEATRILVLGDGIGGGLGAGLLRLGDASGRYDVTLRFNEESGLARPEVYDWPATVSKILGSNSYDVIVVMLGANDRQMMRSGNMRYAFNSPEWVEAYKAQVDMLLDQFSAVQAKVYWVAMPPMADPGYDAAMQQVAAIQRGRVEARGMTFLDLRTAFTAPDGSYTDVGIDDSGVKRRLRGQDGVSFFKAGNNRMAQLVLQAIERGDAVPAVKPAAAEAAPGPAEAASRTPLFGQITMIGEPFTISPEGVTANAIVVAGGNLSPEESLNMIRGMTPPGSNAERLFRTGDPGRAPKGRPDDFTLPPRQTD
jgi:hypothetical protein